MTKTVNIAVIGLNIGRTLVNCLQETPGVHIAGVADLRAEIPAGPGRPPVALADYAASLGARAYNDGVQMLEGLDLDGVCIAVSPAHRKPLIEAAARRGVPIFLEKPLAAHSEMAREIAALIERHPVPFVTDYMMTSMPPMKKYRELAAAGDMGQVITICADLQIAYLPRADGWQWDANNGNGLINENGCHILAPVLSVAGRPQAVHAFGGSFSGARPLEDHAACILKFQSGAVATITVGGCASLKGAAAPVHLDICTDTGQAVISGTDHMFSAITWKTKAADQPATQTWPQPPRTLVMRDAVADFVAAVRGGEPPLCDLRFSLEVQEVTDALIQSIRTGGTVRLDSPAPATS